MPQNVLFKFCGLLTTILFFIIQCTWSPEVQTLIHSSPEGNVALQTSSEFKVPPQHPHIFSESLIKQILTGISLNQELGILQELFISDPEPSPVFSRAQIDFLAPHLVEAFSKSTSEELISFQSLGDTEGAAQANGSIAVFSPSTFFLTLQNTGSYPGNPSKMAASSRNLQKNTTLIFLQKQAMLEPKDAQRLVNISLENLWIAIDYAVLNSQMENEHKGKERKTTAPTTPLKTEETQPKLNTLQKELEDLREKVGEQAEEIRRLQQTAPQ